MCLNVYVFGLVCLCVCVGVILVFLGINFFDCMSLFWCVCVCLFVCASVLL